MSSPTHYCETYGFDADWRRTRLMLIGLGEEDLDRVPRLHEILCHRAGEIVERFYDHMTAHPETAPLLNGFDIEVLKRTHAEYLSSFGVDFMGLGYFEERLRVGMVHAWVQIPLSIYIAAFGVLQRLMHEVIEADSAEEAERRALCSLMLKLSALDVSLASEIYHQAQVRELEASVQNLRSERRLLREQVDTDRLTGLYSRTQTLALLGEALREAARSGDPLCVIMADLDHFKRINDENGHQTGDRVLRDAARRIKSALRDFDVVGRYGGEEFLAILYRTDRQTAAQVAERVRRRMAEHPIHAYGASYAVTLSQGVAEAHRGESVESLVSRADQALYAAKRAGRNCVVVADD
ncbi:diguanylate cyclase [Thiohalobacter sp. IOR34]|uniref:GGDEF domain-containing protein n=1 Tax=Thiohalobacter sp. IOR34 TaxID=3057176 RepID=UPI0025B1084D|nr:diguanylate cyclase [Thiohalobacter sp. IOR34]WJW75759.1 diguanylate cyclase [Thiohalobacter sp. IOR34]